MPKLVTFTLTKVKYSGKAVGDDIFVEIGYKDSILKVKRKIKPGSEVQLNEQIAEVSVAESAFKAKMQIKVIEDDGIFDDVGSKDVEIVVNLNKENPQISTHDIEVYERRSTHAGASKAIFSISIEAVVSSFFYITSESDGGWINGLTGDDNQLIALPESLKVRVHSVKDNRSYFTIEEGRFRGVKASVKISDRGVFLLTHKNEQTAPAALVYSISKKILTWGEEIFQAKDNVDSPWREGIYDVEIPDVPHKKGRPYIDDAKYALVWFPIVYDTNERYIHTGLGSLGCITLADQKKWDNFCKKLLRARKGDRKHVGTLKIVS